MKDYLKKLEKEEEQITIKINKLEIFLQSKKFHELSTIKQQLLVTQYTTMETLNMILLMRLDIAINESTHDNIDREEHHNISGAMNKPDRAAEWEKQNNK